MPKVYTHNQEYISPYGQCTAFVLATSGGAASKAFGCSVYELRNWGGTLENDHHDAQACIRAGEGVVLFRPTRNQRGEPLRRRDTGEVWTPFASTPDGGRVDLNVSMPAGEPKRVTIVREVYDADGGWVAMDEHDVLVADIAAHFWPDALLGM